MQINTNVWFRLQTNTNTCIRKQVISLHISEYVQITQNTYIGMKVTEGTALRASLSGTFLQSLPELVTPLKGELFISAQLSTDAVSAFRDCGCNIASKHARKHETYPPRVKKEKEKIRLDSNDFSFICAGVSNVVSYKRNV